ncbi:reverse transcriptase domain-containing protein [Tanacetum coccineum]
MSLHGKRRNCAWTQGIRSGPRSRQSKDRNFLIIARPLTNLVEKDTPSEFNEECHNAFKLLKDKLACAPVIVTPNWNLPFELTCDASDFASLPLIYFDPIWYYQRRSCTLITQLSGTYLRNKILNHALFVGYCSYKNLTSKLKTENVAAGHLSRIENDETSDDSEVDDKFLGETLMKMNTKDES